MERAPGELLVSFLSVIPNFGKWQHQPPGAQQERGHHRPLFSLCTYICPISKTRTVFPTLSLSWSLFLSFLVSVFPVFLPLVHKASSPIVLQTSPSSIPRDTFFNTPALLWSGLAGQLGPALLRGVGLRPFLAGGGLFRRPWIPVPQPYQDIVLRNGDVAGMDGQPDALLHLRGKPAGLSGPLTALLPGAPGKDRATDQGLSRRPLVQ